VAKSFLAEKRGTIKRIFSFYSTKTVPTIRITTNGTVTALELGKRARLRDNSLVDSLDSKGWDITSDPVPMIHGKNMELGYVTHPAGCTVSITPHIKIQMADENGIPREGRYIEANFEGTIGKLADLDDFNESTERETSRGWVLPLLVGIVAGVVFFAPLFAWLMGLAGGK